MVSSKIVLDATMQGEEAKRPKTFELGREELSYLHLPTGPAAMCCTCARIYTTVSGIHFLAWAGPKVHEQQPDADAVSHSCCPLALPHTLHRHSDQRN